MANTQQQDSSGIVGRGIVLFIVVAAIAAVVLFMIFGRRSQTLPEAKADPVVAVNVVQPGCPFPAVVNWGTLHNLAESLPSAPGWRIRYSAATALARRGSSELPFDVICEILNEDQQMRNHPVRLPSGKTVPDETKARIVILSALQSIQTWANSSREPVKALGAENPGVKQLVAAVEKLIDSQNRVIRTEAKKTRFVLPN